MRVGAVEHLRVNTKHLGFTKVRTARQNRAFGDRFRPPLLLAPFKIDAMNHLLSVGN